MNNIPSVTKYLLIINIVTFVIGFILQQINPEWHTFYFDTLALHHFQSSLFHPHQIFTHMFMHANEMHLLFNMFALFSFGGILEYTLGAKRFLSFYLICGVGAAVLFSMVNFIELQQIQAAHASYIENPDIEAFKNFFDVYYPNARDNESIKDFVLQWDHLKNAPQEFEIIKARSVLEVESIYNMYLNNPMVGASGAIFGLFFAFAYLYPNQLIYIFFIPIGIPAKYMMVFYACIELFMGINQSAGDHVAHFAHLGGLLFGFLTFKFWKIRHG